jgi:hypothetical protein
LWFDRLGCGRVVLVAGAMSAGDDTKIKEAEKKHAIRFVGEENQVLSIQLEESNSDDQDGSINVYSGTVRIADFDLGWVKSFYSPYVLQAEGIESQVVLVPYLVASGTGYGYYEWRAILSDHGRILFIDMGLLRYHSVSREEYVFEIGPTLTTGGIGGTPCFTFKMKTRTEIAEEDIEGVLVLKIIRTKNEPVVQLIPRSPKDAVACLRLYKSHLEEASQWAEQRLCAIIPEEIKKYQDGSKKGRMRVRACDSGLLQYR